MKAQFVYESLNEDQKSFKDLSILSREIFNIFYKKFGNSKSIIEELDWDWEKIFEHIVPLAKFASNKYEKINDFLKSGVGLIYSNFNKKDQDGGAAFFMEPSQYIPAESNLDKKYAEKFPAGLVIFNRGQVGDVITGESLFAHELQHAYDYWRSKGKSAQGRKYNARVILDANPYSKKDPEVEKERKIYYNDTSELSGLFTEKIKGHYWAGWIRYKDDKGHYDLNAPALWGFYDWKEQFEDFKRYFKPWDYLDDKLKKKYANKFYTYYEKIKGIYSEKGYKGLDQYGLKYRGNPPKDES